MKLKLMSRVSLFFVLSSFASLAVSHPLKAEDKISISNKMSPYRDQESVLWDGSRKNNKLPGGSFPSGVPIPSGIQNVKEADAGEKLRQLRTREPILWGESSKVETTFISKKPSAFEKIVQSMKRLRGLRLLNLLGISGSSLFLTYSDISQAPVSDLPLTSIKTKEVQALAGSAGQSTQILATPSDR